jgi:GT2 family glycosyltransferase
VTAIRNIELSEPLCAIDGLDAYSRCMVVMRWHGQIVGREFVPVVDGHVAPDALRGVLAGPPGRVALSRWLDETLDHDERTVAGATDVAATVAVCTRERPDDLRRTLGALMSLSSRGHELLVIDNAPVTDATRSIVGEFPAARYALEPRRGLNAARNRALREASGDVVAFTDDDAAPEPGWLEALLRNLQDRRIVCVTGLTLPLELDTEAQEQFEQHCSFARGFRRRVFDGISDNPLHAGPVGAGANMAVRRDIVFDLGGFDERLDAGTPTRSGGDHEMFVRMLTKGYQIAYDPTAVSWHRHRRTEEELLDTVYGYGTGVYAMWTGLLLERREFGVLRLAWQWFRLGQGPRLMGRGSRCPGAARITRAELRGCLRGPTAWLASRRLRSAED